MAYVVDSPFSIVNSAGLIDVSLSDNSAVVWKITTTGGNNLNIGTATTPGIISIYPDSGGKWVQSSFYRFTDSSDPTKMVVFDISSVSAATTRTISIPDITDIMCTINASQILTNKTLTSPSITGATLSVDDTGSTFNLNITSLSSPALTANRTLTFDVQNSSKTISLGGNITTAGSFTTSGANALTLTTTGATNITLPTSGTLVTSPVGIANGGTGSTTALSGSSIMISNGTAIVQGAAGTTSTVLHGNAAGAPTYGAVALATEVSGILPIANGGTNSNTALSGSSIMISNGTAIIQGAAGTTTTVLHGNAGGSPTYGAVALTTDVSGTLPATNGGTGQSSYAVGDILYASTTSALSKLADVATGNALISGGVNTAPSWGKIALTTHVSGILPVANGGTNSSTSLSGSSIMISNGTAIVQGAAGTTTTVLHGNAGGSPTYSAVSLTTDVSGTLPATNGGTDQSSYAVGDLLYASTTTALSKLADVATGNALISGGVNTAPSWGKIALTTHVSGTLPIANGGTASNTALSGSSIMISNGSAIVQGSAGTTTTVLHGNAAGAPTYSAVSLTADVSGTLPIANGGTNSSTALSGNTIMISNGTSIVQGAAGTTTTVLHGNAGGSPTYGAVSLTADISGTLPVANGGTGQTSYTDGQLLIGNTSGNTLTKATLTAGSGISVTNGNGSITIASSGSSANTEYTDTTGNPYTYNIPTGTKFLRVIMVGAGGGGGNAGSQGGGGGGGAGLLRKLLVPVESGITTVSVTIGAGGTATNAGGTTSMTINSKTINASAGGAGGTGNNTQGGGGGGSAGSGTGGNGVLSNAGGGGNNTANGSYEISITGSPGGTGSTTSGTPGSAANVSAATVLQESYSIGGGGGGGGRGNASGGLGAGCTGGMTSGGTVGTSNGTIGGGGSGGGSGMARGGNGGSNGVAAANGTFGSGGGGAGPTGNGGTGGDGYVLFQPVVI